MHHRHVLENVTADLQERRNRWSRIEELTGMCLQDPIDIAALMSQLGLQPSMLDLKRSAQQDGGKSSSNYTRTPVDFATYEKGSQSGLLDQGGWPKSLAENSRRQSLPYRKSKFGKNSVYKTLNVVIQTTNFLSSSRLP